MAEIKQFERVAELPDEPEKPDIGTQALLLGLKTLSQRALSSSALLATVGSAFVLWYLTPHPDLYQIVSLSLYGIFVLAAIWIVRRK